MARGTYKYETDAGTIVRLRMDTAKKAIASNTEPAGTVDDAKIFAVVADAGRRRKISLAPRGCVFSRTGTGADLNKVFRVFIPCLTPAAQTAISALASITYKGGTYTFVDTISEA